MRRTRAARTGDAAIVAALLAILVGIGLSRFAYSALTPAIVEASWFSPGETAYLGAANLAGYLLGALGGRRLSPRSSPARALRALMLVASVTFVAGAFPLSFAWFFLWRLVSGIAGGALMVLAATTVLPHVAPAKRGMAAGAIFAGVGLGIVLSGTLVPALIGQGLPTAWFVLAALSFAATGLAWSWWPDTPPSEAVGPAAPKVVAGGSWQPALLAVYASYGLIAVGLVPHMIFLVDFVARGLGQGVAAGGRYWVIFGAGALLGPLVAGRLADRIGFDRALRSLLVLHVGGAAILAAEHSAVALAVSSFIVGSGVSGTVPLVLGQTQERVRSPEAQKTAWGIATVTFALGQAGAGYAFSYLFASTEGDFPLLFALGSAALLLGLLVNLLAASPRRRESRPTALQHRG